MIPEDIDSLPLTELIDLLSDNTLKLLETMHQKDANSILIHDLRIDVQLIQQAIQNKKSNKLYKVC